jgi:ABC-type polysaccharide/polyol phosphate transport system ATPase subunit
VCVCVCSKRLFVRRMLSQRLFCMLNGFSYPLVPPSFLQDTKQASAVGPFELTDISLSVTSGMVCGVVGSVGSGKTSLLLALVGNMRRKCGDVSMVKSVGYVPQRAFTISGTVQENITMGLDFDQARFDDCIYR